MDSVLDKKAALTQLTQLGKKNITKKRVDAKLVKKYDMITTPFRRG